MIICATIEANLRDGGVDVSPLERPPAIALGYRSPLGVFPSEELGRANKLELQKSDLQFQISNEFCDLYFE